MSKISVIVPVYNVEKYIGQCLDSIINQTFKDLEILVVNDCSPDNCGKIINEYAKKDARIKVIHNAQNSGYAKSVNTGIKMAQSKYIAIVESDDFIDLNMYENLYSMIEDNNCDVVKCHFYNYWGKTKEDRAPSTIFSEIKNTNFNIKEHPEVLKAHPSVWAALYKKDLLINNSIFFTESENGAYLDILFTFKALICAEKIRLTDTPYLHYRQDNSASTINNPKKIFSISNEYDLLTEYLNAKPEIKPYVNRFKLRKQYRDYRWNLQRILPEYKKEFLDRFVKTFEKLSKEPDFDKDFPSKDKKELMLLLTNSEKYLQKYGQLKTSGIKKYFSLHINKSGIYLSIFNKQIIKKEFKHG